MRLTLKGWMIFTVILASCLYVEPIIAHENWHTISTEELVEKGLNLSKAMKKAAATLDSVGGGHDIAAGATIPKGKEEEFLDILEKEIKTQLS